jgi:uncharacterized membrane protein YqjE
MVESAASSGLFQSLRRVADTALGILHNRAELFAVELQEEKAQVIEVLLWVTLLLFFGMLCVLVLTATLILLCPPDTRIFVAAGFTLLYLVGAVWAFGRLKVKLHSPAPFVQTINEVQKDRELLLK